MAKRRMIWKKISLSEQFNDMPEFAQLFFSLMIPHADDWGVVKGTARVIKGAVMPLNEGRTAEEVEAALEEMDTNRLIWRYEPDSEGPMLQFRKWEDHQTGLTKRTRPKQKLYFYPEEARKLLEADGIQWDYEEFHRDSEKFLETPPEQKGTKQKRTKRKRKEPKAADAASASSLSSLWNDIYTQLLNIHDRAAIRDVFSGAELMEVKQDYVLIHVQGGKPGLGKATRLRGRVEDAAEYVLGRSVNVLLEQK